MGTNTVFQYGITDENIYQHTPLVTPRSTTELEKLLESYNISTGNWGINNAKNLTDLFRECELGIVRFSQATICLGDERIKKLVRTVGVVRLNLKKVIDGKTFVLRELKQYFIEDEEQAKISKTIYNEWRSGYFDLNDSRLLFRSRIRKDQLLNKKVRQNSPIPAIAREALIYDLKIPQEIVCRIEYVPCSTMTLLPAEGISYPGLLNIYHINPYIAELSFIPTSEILIEITETTMTVYTWVEE